MTVAFAPAPAEWLRTFAARKMFRGSKGRDSRRCKHIFDNSQTDFVKGISTRARNRSATKREWLKGARTENA